MAHTNPLAVRRTLTEGRQAVTTLLFCFSSSQLLCTFGLSVQDMPEQVEKCMRRPEIVGVRMYVSLIFGRRYCACFLSRVLKFAVPDGLPVRPHTLSPTASHICLVSVLSSICSHLRLYRRLPQPRTGDAGALPNAVLFSVFPDPYPYCAGYPTSAHSFC